MSHVGMVWHEHEPSWHGGAGKYTVPVLWDKKENTIVNNESSEIMRMLNRSALTSYCAPSLGFFMQLQHVATEVG